jgi:endonuclease/exonuclease/phosphatase family metal-dependent hydrolase
LFKIVSYNVHRCVGTDRRRDPERIAQLLQDLNADVIGLQEVDFNPPGESKLHQLDVLAATTGMTAIAGLTIRRAGAEYGNALLTRGTVAGVDLHDLSVSRREPRGLIDARVLCAGRKIRVLVTHLGLRINERRRQTQVLLNILQQESEPSDVTVVLGDINEWRPRGFAPYVLDKMLGRSPSPRTFPSVLPVFSLDRIWVAPRAALLNMETPNRSAAQVASDHRPLIATLDLSHPAVNNGRIDRPGGVSEP